MAKRVGNLGDNPPPIKTTPRVLAIVRGFWAVAWRCECGMTQFSERTDAIHDEKCGRCGKMTVVETPFPRRA